MTPMTEKTAAEQIREEWKGRLEAFQRLTKYDADESDEQREEREQELYEYPLDVSLVRMVRIDLSTGGPGDWLEVQLDSESEAQRIEYHFAPWFDHASITLDGDEFEAAD